VTATAIRPLTIWLVIAMEAVFAAVLLAGIVARTDPPLLGQVAALSLLPLGYLCLRHLGVLRPPRPRLVAGLAVALALRLALTSAAAQPSAAAWVLGAVVPALVGLGLWWRGGALATSELTASDVRDEFFFLGIGLLLLITLFRVMVSLSGPPLLLGLLLFVGCGLLAVGMARQDGAGSPSAGRARLLELAAVVGLLLVGTAVVAALQPELVAALWQALGLVLGALGSLLLWLLQPLLRLLSGLTLPAPGQPAGQFGQGLPQPQPAQPGEPPPAWIAWLLLIVGLLLATVAVVLLVGLLFLALSAVSRRGRRSGDPNALVDRAGGAGEDARALLAGLRRWLGRLRRGTALPMRRPRPQLDSARAAYRALLRWAKEQGVERAPPETTQQFKSRLDERLPHGAPTYAAITESYELERYGDLPAPRDRLRLLEQQLEALHEPPETTPDSARSQP
jgi:hypothetical protein